VREEWRDALLAGTDAAEASARMIRRWDAGLDTQPPSVEFWTGLAAAQHETGHLQSEVRDTALALIERGGDAELYEDGAPARLRALHRLKVKLEGPQPKPKKLRGPRAGPDPGVEVGDVVRIWSSDRTVSILYAVTRLFHHKRQRWPELLGLYWEGGAAPSREELEQLPYLSTVDFSSFDRSDALPDSPFGWAAPEELTVVVSRPGEEFRSDIGETVATGVRRDPPYPRSGTVTGWDGIVAMLDGGGLPFKLEATRRRLAKYGPDPRAWEQAQREYVASLRESAGGWIAQMLATPADDPELDDARGRIMRMFYGAADDEPE
jgi:hypothetical protein